MRRFVGLGICFFIILVTLNIVGMSIFIDLNSLVLVLSGGIGFLLMQGEIQGKTHAFIQGAVYFGWLGFLIGLIAIAANRYGVLGEIDSTGRALAVALLPLFYAYIAKLVSYISHAKYVPTSKP